MVGSSCTARRARKGAALTLAWCSVIGADFALPRDADRRSAFQALPAHLRGWRSLSISPFPLPGDPPSRGPGHACGVGLGLETCELYLH